MGTPTSTETPKSAVRSGIDVLLVIVILGALAAITIFVVTHYKGQSTDAATILGIVVPAFATIGAAAFGITVAYNAGAAKGETKGDAKAKDAATQAASATASSLSAYVEPALNAVRQMRDHLETAATNPAGENLLVFGVAGDDPHARGAAPVSLDPQPIHDAELQLERLGGAIDALVKK